MSSDNVEATAADAAAPAAGKRQPLRTATSEQPLLLLFLVPLLVLVGLVVLIGSGTTWLWVGVAVAWLAGMTLAILRVIGRLVDDGGGPSH